MIRSRMVGRIRVSVIAGRHPTAQQLRHARKVPLRQELERHLPSVGEALQCAHERGSLPFVGSEDRWRDQVAKTREAHPEPREADLERREAAVEAREIVVEAREAAHAERIDAAREIRAAADKRDAASDDRDVAAGKRENDLDRAEMLDLESKYGAHWPERRNAGLDRGHAKDDRTASHDDRIALTEGDVEDHTDGT